MLTTVRNIGLPYLLILFSLHTFESRGFQTTSVVDSFVYAQIAQLGSKNYYERIRAVRALRKLEGLAYSRLNHAREHARDPEVRWRSQLLWANLTNARHKAWILKEGDTVCVRLNREFTIGPSYNFLQNGSIIFPESYDNIPGINFKAVPNGNVYNFEPGTSLCFKFLENRYIGNNRNKYEFSVYVDGTVHAKAFVFRTSENFVPSTGLFLKSFGGLGTVPMKLGQVR